MFGPPSFVLKVPYNRPPLLLPFCAGITLSIWHVIAARRRLKSKKIGVAKWNLDVRNVPKLC